MSRGGLNGGGAAKETIPPTWKQGQLTQLCMKTEKKTGRSYSGLMSPNVKYLALAEGSLHIEGQRSGTVMREQ